MSKRNHADLLVAGCEAQMEKLRENDHKPGFDMPDFDYAYKRLEQEMVELHTELYGIPGSVGRDFSAIRREAADIANFAHFIILWADQEMKK